MAENLRIWNAVGRTDPAHTKAVTFGRKFTSIDAHWQIMRATEQFGPIGQGWGYNVEHSVERLAPEMILAVADVTLWWLGEENDTMAGHTQIAGLGSVKRMYSYGPVRGSCEMWAPKRDKGNWLYEIDKTTVKMQVDEDAPKKAMTDALTKGLSHLGFSADVFLGLFDDNRYVQRMKKEFEQTSVPMGTPPGDFANEARADGLTTEERSTYQVEKDKKLALLRDSALLAIGTSENRPQLSVWWGASKDELKKKLSDEDYVTVYEAVIAKRDTLPGFAG